MSTRAAENPRRSAYRPVCKPWSGADGEMLLWALFAAVFGHALYFLFLNIAQPVTGPYGFRQAQTAISVFWILRDGVHLSYETPVLGYPWTIPLEFPVYQWLLAAVAYFGAPIEIAGRLWSFTFFAALMLPLRVLYRALELPWYALPITGILLFASPLYIYFARTVSIETCALFFAAVWLALLVRFLKQRSAIGLPTIIAAGALAALAKMTTFIAFGAVGAVTTMTVLWQVRRSRREIASIIALSGLAGFVPFAIGYGWTIYSDRIKSLGLITSLLTSGVQRKWVFGSLDTRLFAAFWQNILDRDVHNVLGYGAPVALLVCGAALMDRTRPYILIALAGFVMAPLMFAGLFHQDYYVVANGIFAIVAVALGITALAGVEGTHMVAVAIVAILAGQLLYFQIHFADYVRTDTRNEIYQIALKAKEHIPPSSGLIVFNGDWSSEVNFYAERKGIAVPFWLPLDIMLRLSTNPASLLGDMPLGGIVHCANPAPPYRSPLMEAINAFISERKVIASIGQCKLLAAENHTTGKTSIEVPPYTKPQ
jgi:hypothetical protein